MSGFVDLLEIVKKALEEAERDFGKINVLIAGRTGVGKSTLINSVFRGSLATTGQGEPVTQTTRLLSKQGVPLAIWDTRGLEMADFAETLGELTRLVETRLQDPNPHNHVHVAWLCLHEDGRRVEAAERDLCRTLAEHVPVIAVITKARRDDGFRAGVDGDRWYRRCRPGRRCQSREVDPRWRRDHWWDDFGRHGHRPDNRAGGDLRRVARCGGRSGRWGGAGRRCGQAGVYETGGAKVGKTRLAVREVQVHG